MESEKCSIENINLAGPSEVQNHSEEDEYNDGRDSSHLESSQLNNKEVKPLNMKPGAIKLRYWLNKCLRVEMTDGRVLIGVFLCTDRDANVILGSCAEYLPGEKTDIVMSDEPRMLGLVMIPGKHIVNVSIDLNENITPCHPLIRNESEII